MSEQRQSQKVPIVTTIAALGEAVGLDGAAVDHLKAPLTIEEIAGGDGVGLRPVEEDPLGD